MTTLVMQLGPLGVFLLMIPESACVPLPSEVTLGFAGFAVSAGWMPLWLAIAAATAGNVVGSLVAYGIGRAISRRELGGSALGRSRRLLDERGNRAVFLARLMPLVRTFVSLPAGWARVPVLPFVVMTTLGCAIWAAAFVLLGMAAGGAWAQVGGLAGKVLLALTAVAAVAVPLARRRTGSTAGKA